MRPAEDLTSTKRKKFSAMNKHANIEVKLSKMTKVSESDQERSSPDPNCSICLSKMNDKSFTDRCFHMFCFDCLVEWSKINAVCPLCKQPFKQIFHNIKSMSEYAVYDVHSHPSAYIQGDYDSDYNPLFSTSQGFLTDMGLVAMFLAQPSNQRAFGSWLKEHIRGFMRADIMQSSFLADVLIGLLKMFNLSSGQFFDTINRFFGERTADFIRSLDVNLHTFIFHGIREPSFDQLHQQNSHFLPESERRGSQVHGLSPLLADRSTLSYIDLYQECLRRFTRPDVTDGLTPGPSRISLVLSLLKPSNSTRANAGSSSSSSSPPPEEELIDIEQLEDSLQRNHHARDKSPICVSSEEEDHVQLVECSSSRTRPRIRAKRKHTTFLLVSSDDEASVKSESVQDAIHASKKRKKSKPAENLSTDAEEPESNVTREKQTRKEKIKEDVKVTFKKHPTGHKNSLKKNRSIMLENQNLSEKSSEMETSQISAGKQDCDATGGSNDLPSSSSSYQPDRESVLTDENEKVGSSENVITLTVKQKLPKDMEQRQSSVLVFGQSATNKKSEDDSKDDIILNEEIVDIDAISVYSDDSIQLLDDDTFDYCIHSDDDYGDETKRSCSKQKNEFNERNLDIEVLNETNTSDIFIISSSVSRKKKKRSSPRATHIFVDLSDDNCGQEVSISEPSASGSQNFVPIVQHTSDDDDREFPTLIANNYCTNAVYLQNSSAIAVDCHSDIEQSTRSASQLVEVLRGSGTLAEQDSLDTCVTEEDTSLDISHTSICIDVSTSNERSPLTTPYENFSTDTSKWAVDSVDVNI